MRDFSGPHLLTMGLTLFVSQSILCSLLSASEVPALTSPSVAPAVTQIPTAATAAPSSAAIVRTGVLLSPSPRISSVPGLPASFCGHVIDLLVNNQIRQQIGQFDAGPVVTFPYFPGAEVRPGDVELPGVSLVTEGASGDGPIFQLMIRNNGATAVEGIPLSLVGVTGQIHVQSPSATVTMPRMEAGAAGAFQIQLPASAMVMSTGVQTTGPFEMLVAAVDSLDPMSESGELYSVLILKRTEIPPIAATITATRTTVTSGPAGGGQATVTGPGMPNVRTDAVPESPAQPAPGSAPTVTAPPVESQAPEPVPGNGVAPDPIEKIDLDQLDLGKATESSLRFQ